MDGADIMALSSARSSLQCLLLLAHVCVLGVFEVVLCRVLAGRPGRGHDSLSIFEGFDIYIMNLIDEGLSGSQRYRL